MGFDLEVLPSAALAAEAAARKFILAANDAIGSRGEFVVALSGGATPQSVYQRLAAEPFASSLDWSRVQVLWGDERCVPPAHEASNYRMARKTLLDTVPVREANLHRIHGEDDPSEAAAGYQRVLRSVLRTPVGAPRTVSGCRIDLVLLGLGLDGHTASLFPSATAHEAGSRWAVAARDPSGLMWRVTLTPIVINAAADIVFLVSGGAKAAILRRVLEGPHRPNDLPAQSITPTAGRALWLVDAAAASDLRRVAGR